MSDTPTNQTAAWASLHREDGSELTPESAPGYTRVLYSTDSGAAFPKAREDWGWVFFATAWDAPVGGNRVSPFIDVQRDWIRQ